MLFPFLVMAMFDVVANFALAVDVDDVPPGSGFRAYLKEYSGRCFAVSAAPPDDSDDSCTAVVVGVIIVGGPCSAAAVLAPSEAQSVAALVAASVALSVAASVAFALVAAPLRCALLRSASWFHPPGRLPRLFLVCQM